MFYSMEIVDTNAYDNYSLPPTYLKLPFKVLCWTCLYPNPHRKSTQYEGEERMKDHSGLGAWECPYMGPPQDESQTQQTVGGLFFLCCVALSEVNVFHWSV